MKKCVLLVPGLFILLSVLNAQTYCPSSSTGSLMGSGPNILTFLRNNQNQIIYNKDLDLLMFIHRNNPGVYGGSSGHLRVDFSRDGGRSWVSDTFLVNPANGASASRYPNISIFNPDGNTEFDSAFLVYVSSTNNNGAWNGYNYGVRKLSSTSSPTENYINSTQLSNTLIADNLVQGSKGVFWATDLIDSTPDQGWRIFKGVFDTTQKDVIWNLQQEIRPVFFDPNAPVIAGSSLAFDPTGRHGWFVGLTHLSGIINDQRVYPYLWFTNDSGNSWNGPIEVDWKYIHNLEPNAGLMTAGAFECDITVDTFGNPHILMDMSINSNPAAANYTIPNGPTLHAMFDITYTGKCWLAYKLKNLYTLRGTYTTGQSWSHDNRPQCGRNSSGTKLFFTWLDADSSSSNLNLKSRIQCKALDIIKQCWTPLIDFTKCSGYTDTVFMHTLSPIVRDSAEYSDLPIVICKQKGSALYAPDFYYLQNARIHDSLFSITIPNIGFSGQLPKLCGTNGIDVFAYPDNAQYSWSTGGSDSAENVTSFGYVKVNITGGCTDVSDSIKVLPAIIPDLTISGSTFLCNGSSVDLTLNNSGTISWSTGASSNTITVSSGGWVSYTITDSCGTLTDSVYITDAPTQKLAVTGNLNICPGDSVLLNAGSLWQSYSWSNNSSDTQIVVKNPGSYFCSITDSNGCVFETDTIYIAYKNIPPATIQMNKTGICPGDSVMLFTTSSSNYIYQWYLNGTAIQGLNKDTIFITQGGTYKITVTDTVSGCSKTSGGLTISNYSNPTANINYTGNTKFCKGGSVLLSAGSTSGISYQWFLDGNAIQGATNNTYNATLGGIYTVRTTNTSGCFSISSGVTVLVDSINIPQILKSAGGICSGDTLKLWINYQNNYTYQWRLNNSDITGATDTIYKTIISGDYSLSIKDTSTQCAAITGSLSIMAYNKPNVTITPPGTLRFCPGDSMLLVAIGSSNVSYTWYLDSNQILSAYNDSLYISSAGKYNCWVTNQNGCSRWSVGVSAVFDTIPAFKLSGKDSGYICQGDSFHLQCPLFTSYSWLYNGNIVSGKTNNNIYISQPGQYEAVVTNLTGCIRNSEKFILNFYQIPTVSISYNSGILTANGTGLVSYQWYFNGTLLNNAILKTLIVTQNGDYTVVITDSNGCKAQSAPYQVNGLGIDNVNNSGKCQIYPIPASDYIYIDLALNSEIIHKVIVTDIAGRIVEETKIYSGNGAFDIRHLSSGNYLLTIYTNNNLYKIKFIKSGN